MPSCITKKVRVINKDGGYAMNARDTACPNIADLINSQLGKKVKTTQQGARTQESQLLQIPHINPQRQAAARATLDAAAAGGATSSDRAAELARLHQQAGFGGDGDGGGEEEEYEEEAAAPVDPNVKKGVKMQAVANYTAANSEELSFKAGEKIFIVLKDPSQKMWQGVLAGEIGLVPSSLVEEYDVDARTADVEQKKAAIASAGIEVKITRCVVKTAYTAAGPGELSLAAGSAVMLPTMDEHESPHTPGVVMYKGVNAGTVGLMPKDCLEVSNARASSSSLNAPAAPAAPAAAAAASGGEDAGDQGAVLSAMADKLFELIKPDADGCLGGKQLQPVMSKCNPAVPGAMLGKIWSACDSAKAGKLNKSQVVKMLGFIGQVQAGMTPNPAAYMTAPAPTIDGLPIPGGGGGGGGGAAAAPAPAPVAAGGMSLTEIVDKLFGMIAPDADGCLTGAQMMPVMSKCSPPIAQDMLGKIWTVCDDKKTGKLSKLQVMKCFGLMSQAQSGGMPNPAELNASTLPPKIDGLN